MKRYLSICFAFLLAAMSFSGEALAQTTPDAVVKNAVEGTVDAMKADPAAKGGDMAKITQLCRRAFCPRRIFSAPRVSP